MGICYFFVILLFFFKKHKSIVTVKQTRDVEVGDIIVVQDGQTFPADLLLIGVAPETAGESPPSFCHIETSNIDGETTLKVRTVPELLNEINVPLYDLSGTYLDNNSRRSAVAM